MSYMFEVEIDGKVERKMLEAMPTSIIARLYEVEQTETLSLLGEKVLK